MTELAKALTESDKRERRGRVRTAAFVGILATIGDLVLFLPIVAVTLGGPTSERGILFLGAIATGWIAGSCAVWLARLITDSARGVEARWVGAIVAVVNVIYPHLAPSIYNRFEGSGMIAIITLVTFVYFATFLMLCVEPRKQAKMS